MEAACERMVQTGTIDQQAGQERIAHSRAESGVADLEGENGESRAMIDPRDVLGAVLADLAPKTGRTAGPAHIDIETCMVIDLIR